MFIAALQQHPFLRLLLPLVIGIVCGDAFPHAVPMMVWTGILAVSCICLFVSYLINWKHLFGLLLFILLVTTGFGLAAKHLADTSLPASQHASIYQITINQTPEQKERSILCPAVIIRIQQADSTLETPHPCPQVLLYLQPDSAAASLKRGDQLWIQAHILPPANKGLPHEFDYARFLQRRGISGTAFVPTGRWQKVGHDFLRTFRQKAADQQEKIVNLYRRLGFQGDELAVLSALTVGDKDELSEDIIETYSITGASHVLALSGLHIGFLYALFWLLMAPLWKRWRLLKLPLLTFIVLLLWGFAFLTGLSPSVVRSVCMFSILTLSHPMWLFDVGFQLSFVAVASILMFYPKLNRLYSGDHWIIRKVWGLMSVSIAAQIGTAPLVIFYFSRFSTHFLFTNLWVIPMVSLVLYASVFLLLLSPFTALQAAVAPYVGKLVEIQNHVLQQIEHWPYASFDHLSLDVCEVLFIYLIFLLIYRYQKLPIPANAYVLLSTVLIFCTYHTAARISQAPRKSIAFYNVQGCPSVHCLTDGARSWLVCADSLPRSQWFCQSLSSHWNRMRLEPPKILTGHHTGAAINLHDNILRYEGKRICLLNDNRWRGKSAARPLPVDYLYIARGYQGGISELTSLFRIQTVILDGSLSPYSRKKITEDCLKQGIRYRLLDQEGHIQILL